MRDQYITRKLFKDLTILLLFISSNSFASYPFCAKSLTNSQGFLKPTALKPSKTQKNHLDEIKGLILEHVNWTQTNGLNPSEQKNSIRIEGELEPKNLAAKNAWLARNKSSRSGRALIALVRDWTHQELIVNLNEMRKLLTLLDIVENRNVQEDFDELTMNLATIVDSNYQSSFSGIRDPVEETIGYGLMETQLLVFNFFDRGTPYNMNSLIVNGRKFLKLPKEIANFDSVIKNFFQTVFVLRSATFEWLALTENNESFLRPSGEKNVSVLNLLNRVFTPRSRYSVQFQFNNETLASETMTRGIRQPIIKTILYEMAQNISNELANIGLPNFHEILFEVEVDEPSGMIWIKGKNKSPTKPFPFKVFGPDHIIGTTTKTSENRNSVRNTGVGIGLWKAKFYAQLNGMSFDIYWSPENGGEVTSKLGLPIFINQP